MANFVYNAAKKIDRNFTTATVKALLLKATSTADKDHDFVSNVLSGNNEANATNYARKTLAGKSIVVDDVNDRADLKASDILWAILGGAINNTLDRLIVYWEVTNDADSIPIAAYDLSHITSGADFTWAFNSGVVLRAT